MGREVPIPYSAVRPKSPACYTQTVELTGNGNLLCYECFSGRWFRSSKDAVEDALDEFVRLYNGMITEDPECTDPPYYLNMNDLYSLLNISTSDFGYAYGWAPDPDYMIEDFSMSTVLVPAEKDFEHKGEDVLMITFDDIMCRPYDYYSEM